MMTEDNNPNSVVIDPTGEHLEAFLEIMSAEFPSRLVICPGDISDGERSAYGGFPFALSASEALARNGG